MNFGKVKSRIFSSIEFQILLPKGLMDFSFLSSFSVLSASSFIECKTEIFFLIF